MTALDEAVAIVHAHGWQRVTPVPAELYAQVEEHIAPWARFSVNNERQNLIVAHSHKGAHAIAPVTIRPRNLM